ncbi:CDP-alcohol phosphatidyltransferase family protein, partial [Streptomyces fuscigenes]|nr:CDP-alcohol phosphatidyltransferase family protein [Streptomyces fuscigenes]
MSTAILTGHPVPGSPLDGHLRSLGFDVRSAGDGADAARLVAAAPAGERVALVDTRFVGHLHALRLALTDPRFPLSATTGVVTARPEARAALVRALGESGRDAVPPAAP